MHKKYLDLQREDVAKAFGLLQDGNTDKDDEEVESQVVDFREGEGRCPVVPLVFKTSLGIVRSPEGSTPSLLRQDSTEGRHDLFGKQPHRSLDHLMRNSAEVERIREHVEAIVLHRVVNDLDALIG